VLNHTPFSYANACIADVHVCVLKTSARTKMYDVGIRRGCTTKEGRAFGCSCSHIKERAPVHGMGTERVVYTVDRNHAYTVQTCVHSACVHAYMRSQYIQLLRHENLTLCIYTA